jgi:Cu+-exporting ATPase
MANRRIVLPIRGMECGTCAGVIQRRLAAAEGVREAHVNFISGEATVDVTETGPTAADLIRAVREAGFDCGGTAALVEIEGLRDAASISRLEQVLMSRQGVLRASANQSTERLEVEYLPDVVSARDIENLVGASGFAVSPPIDEADPVERECRRHARLGHGLGWRFAVALVVTLLSTVASVPLMSGSTTKGGDLVARLARTLDTPLRRVVPQLYRMDVLALQVGLLVAALVVIVVGGRPFLTSAWQAYRHRSADANTLIVLGTLVTFLYSAVAVAVPAIWPASGFPPDVYFESVSGIVAFALLGRWLAARASLRTYQAEHGLMRLQPRVAKLRRNGESLEAGAHQVRVGDRVVVAVGESIPVDGAIVSGDSTVDLSMFPAGAASVSVRPGVSVLAGAINRTALLEVAARSTSTTTVLAQALRLVERAQYRKGPTQQATDRWSAKLPPIVIAVALLVLAAWVVPGSEPVAALAVLAFVTVVVIAAPATLSLAAPMAIKTAIGRAAQLGAIIRGGDVIDKLQRVDTLVFGKTGTITEGRPTVSHVVGARRADNTAVSPSEILQVAAAVEARSEHPLARAILASAKEKGVDVPGVERFVEMKGRGVRGIVGRFLVEVISVRHARERSLELGRLAKDVDRHVLAGRTPAVVVVNDVVRGLIIFTDPTKPSAKRAIGELGALGYTLFMLSGDSKATARLVAKETGIDRVVAEVEPRNKADEIKRLQEDGRVVAVIADGIDDARALAQADVGIAIGVGPEIAKLASDVTLPGHDLRGVVTGVEIARRTARVIRTNLLFSLVYHLVGIPLAAGLLYPVSGLLLTPMVAAGAAVAATSVVAAHSVRLGRFTPTSAA